MIQLNPDVVENYCTQCVGIDKFEEYWMICRSTVKLQDCVMIAGHLAIS
jgi:hypothetical protein